MPSNHETLLRQWQMLRSIPRYPGKTTALRLKENLDIEGMQVSKRTIERDLLDLSRVFPLLLDDRSRPYGWSWQQDAPSFDLPGLGSNEALMLMMVEQHLQQLLPMPTLEVMVPYFKTARQLLSTLAKAKPMLAWSDKVRNVPPTQPLLAPKVNLEVQRIVSEALLNNLQLNISYQPRGKKLMEYRIHPLALVQRGLMLYLYVRIFDYEDMRILAMHRILSADILEASTQYPQNFDIDEEIAKGMFGFGEGGLIQLKAKFKTEYGAHLYETPLGVDQKIEEIAEDSLMVKATVADTPQLFWWLLAMGDGVEVMEPVDLRERIIETITGMSKIYEGA